MKMKLTPYAKFVRDGDFEYRTETYLSLLDIKEEFIKSLKQENCIGTVIMINPGSSRCKGEYGQIDKATMDTTMKIIKKCISSAYKNRKCQIPSKGYIEIFNLFNLCGKKLTEAVRIYKEHNNKNSFMESQIKVRPYTPWIWLAWGCNHDELDKRRDYLYKNLINKFSKKIVRFDCGKYPDKKRFWHPYPLNFKKMRISKIRLYKKYQIL